MDLYILDDMFKQKEVVDTFSSLIWTERYNDAGDVTLVVPSDSFGKANIVEGAFLSTPASREVMLIDTVSDEAGQITAVGKTLVAFLANRLLRDSLSTNKDSWQITDTYGQIAATIVREMCMSGGMMESGSVLPNPDGSNSVIQALELGPIYDDGATKDVAVPYGDVFTGMKGVCDLGKLGFSLYPSPTGLGYTLVFTVYQGLDRTSGQVFNEVVIFEPALDTFTNIKSVRSIDGFKTAAYAFASGAGAAAPIGIAYAAGLDGAVDFNRRVMTVDASDVNASDYDSTKLKSILDRKAEHAIVNNNYVKTTDGELVPQESFQFGVNYGMGDIIELRGSSNVAQKARVTEYIRSQDTSGERSYPTLSVIG